MMRRRILKYSTAHFLDLRHARTVTEAAAYLTADEKSAEPKAGLWSNLKLNNYMHR